MRRLHLARSYRNAVMALGPVGYWRLGETAGTVAKDETGANDGSYVGSPTLGAAGLLAGDPDTGVTFANGKYATAAALAASPAISAAVWVRNVTVASDSYMEAIGNGWAAVAGRWAIYVIRLTGGSVWRPTMDVYDTTTREATFGNRAIDGVAHFIVGTYDGATVRVYLDGTLGSTTAAATGSLASNPLVIGSSAPAEGGTIDEPAIWNRALAASEIARLYQIGRGY